MHSDEYLSLNSPSFDIFFELIVQNGELLIQIYDINQLDCALLLGICQPSSLLESQQIIEIIYQGKQKNQETNKYYNIFRQKKTYEQINNDYLIYPDYTIFRQKKQNKQQTKQIIF
ncbi:hypothetical protein pb186bvf_019510 [Paramecium bursaria]